MYVHIHTYVRTVNITTKYVCTYIRMYALPLLTVCCLIKFNEYSYYFKKLYTYL